MQLTIAGKSVDYSNPPLKWDRVTMGKFEVGPDDPVPLSEAVRLFFPRGGVTVSALRTEARKGRLAIERIAGKDFVTKAAIDKMRKLCRVEAKALGSTCGDERVGEPFGSFETEKMRLAQDAVKATASALKKRSRPTGRAGSGRTTASVIRGAFGSRTS